MQIFLKHLLVLPGFLDNRVWLTALETNSPDLIYKVKEGQKEQSENVLCETVSLCFFTLRSSLFLQPSPRGDTDTFTHFIFWFPRQSKMHLTPGHMYTVFLLLKHTGTSNAPFTLSHHSNGFDFHLIISTV